MKKLQVQKVRVTGDVPAPRFGHTFTMVSANKAVLFGGAVSLAGKFVITNETHLYNMNNNSWKKLNFDQGFVPSERAAHTAVMVSEMQMIIYGGAASGTQGLLKDELYILDIRKQLPVWKIIQISNKNSTPGQRYGHTMVFNKPYLVVFGGNSGNKAENDVWLLNILKGPFKWQKYEFPNKIVPCPRVYHSAAICEEGSAAGMMVIFGGRKETKKDHNGSQRQLTVAALNDIWGLRKHRDGSWDWVTPPRSEIYSPICRYQHLICFMGSMLVIMGGRSSNPEEVVSALQIYDTQKSQWFRENSSSRYRHAVVLYNKTKLLIHGGFEPQMASQPLESMISIDLSTIYIGSNESQNENKISLQNQNNTNNMSMTSRRQGLREFRESERNISTNSRLRSGTSQLQRSKIDRDLTPSRIINLSKSIRLSNQVVIATNDNNNIQIQRVPVQSLLEQSKKLNGQPQVCNNDQNILDIIDTAISVLMPTNNIKNNLPNFFPLKKDKIYRICAEVNKILAEESSLIGVRSPVKIFGSLYGRYYDLLRIFDNFGYPDTRELETYEYIFLGNYVGKGTNSLQTICLLLALKVKFPDHIRLLRGQQEDSNINKISGLAEECQLRLGQNINEPNSIFNAFNYTFDMLPLAAAIEDKFLCINGGLGEIQSIVDIKNVMRPCKVHNNQVITDLLWSQSGGNKYIQYNSKQMSEADIQQFLDKNGLQTIINAQDGLIDGIKEDRSILSLSSVPNYAGSGNKAGILKINKNLSVVPYLVNKNPIKKGGWVNQGQVKSNISLLDMENQYRKTMFEIK